MLQVTNLTKIYNHLVANDHLNFTVNPGEIAVLLGPNGAGKSTAIKCIAGLLRFQGNISICGHPNKSVEAKRNFGYIPELPALFEALTVREHLEFVARAYKVDGWEKKADALLQRMELDDKQKKLGGELSKGMQQKVSICCALLSEPKVIMLDEPLVGLDPHADASGASAARLFHSGEYPYVGQRRRALGQSAHHGERPDCRCAHPLGN